MQKSGGTSRDGFALVTTLLVVLVLSLLAVGIAWLASSEKKTSFAEQVHISSVFSADAGTEGGINLLRLSEIPMISLSGDRLVATVEQTPVQGSQSYEYDIYFVSISPNIGWGTEYPNFDYRIDSSGYASSQGKSLVTVLASRMYPTNGY